MQQFALNLGSCSTTIMKGYECLHVCWKETNFMLHEASCADNRPCHNAQQWAGMTLMVLITTCRSWSIIASTASRWAPYLTSIISTSFGASKWSARPPFTPPGVLIHLSPPLSKKVCSKGDVGILSLESAMCNKDSRYRKRWIVTPP